MAKGFLRLAPAWPILIRLYAKCSNLAAPLVVTGFAAVLVLTGCRGSGAATADFERMAHPTTAAIDVFQIGTPEDYPQPQGKVWFDMRQGQHKLRWASVQRAVAHHGTTHRGAFYGSRAYWHSGSSRGLGWALDHQGDLNEPFYVAGRGNVRVLGDVNAEVEVAGDAVVHIFGDLDAPLELRGVCEVIVAGRLTENATIICNGQLELFVGGDTAGIFGATQSATIIIDGNAGGVIQCGAPATTLTVTGDLLAELPGPKGKNAVLDLRVDGYAPTRAMLDLATAGYTRVTATLGVSNVPPGLYPESLSITPSAARWVVLRQRVEP